MTTNTIKNPDRLASIDVLRGFDMFFLVGAGDILRRLINGFETDALQPVMYQLQHAEWTGFTAWDIIMPLFLFTSGLSMPFSFSKYLNQGSEKSKLYLKILKRFCILFLLGWIVQGNLLDLSIDRFHVYCNTLHAIAFGYLITSLIVLNVKDKLTQLLAGISLIIVYWLLLIVIPVPGFGSGILTPEGNLAIFIDHSIFGRFDDSTQYTWLITSLGFGATVYSGFYAGAILKQNLSQKDKLKRLLIIGSMLIAISIMMSFSMPIIKKIWSPTMILLSSGICFILLAISFYITDIKKFNGKIITALRIFGLNSIAAYVLYSIFGLGKISALLLRGFEQYTGSFFPLLVSLGQFIILFLILRHMYKYKIFLKI